MRFVADYLILPKEKQSCQDTATVVVSEDASNIIQSLGKVSGSVLEGVSRGEGEQEGVVEVEVFFSVGTEGIFA